LTETSLLAWKRTVTYQNTDMVNAEVRERMRFFGTGGLINLDEHLVVQYYNLVRHSSDSRVFLTRCAEEVIE
jgi:hypothetical protein